MKFVSLFLVGLTGWADYLTGYEMSFSVFYLLPVLLASWFIERNWGLVIAILSATVWLTANTAAGEFHANRLLPYWNAIVRFGFFLTATLLASRLRLALQRETDIARSDYLTGAANSRYFFEICSEELSRARRHQRSFAVVYVDCDNFKKVNDEMGHGQGDALLRQIANALRTNLRVTDKVARLGGDEFVVLLPETPSAMTPEVLSKLQRNLTDALRSGLWPVTFSIGAVTFEAFPAGVDEMIRLADSQMYEAKRSGKNCIRHQTYQATATAEPPA